MDKMCTRIEQMDRFPKSLVAAKWERCAHKRCPPTLFTNGQLLAPAARAGARNLLGWWRRTPYTLPPTP